MKFPKFKGLSQTPQSDETPAAPVISSVSDVGPSSESIIPTASNETDLSTTQPEPGPDTDTNPPTAGPAEITVPIAEVSEKPLPFHGVPPPPVPSSSSETSTEAQKEGKKKLFQRLKKHGRKPSIDVALPIPDPEATSKTVAPSAPPAFNSETQSIIDKDKADKAAEKEEERRKQHYLDTLNGFTPEKYPDAKNENNVDSESNEKVESENQKQPDVKESGIMGSGALPIEGGSPYGQPGPNRMESQAILNSVRRYPSITQGIPPNFQQHDFMAPHSGPTPNTQSYLPNEYSFSVTPATAPLYMSPPSPASNPAPPTFPPNDALPATAPAPGETPSQMAEMFASRAFGGAGNIHIPFPTVPPLVPPPPPPSRDTSQHDFLGGGGNGNDSPSSRPGPIGWSTAHLSVPSHPLYGLPQAIAPPSHGPRDLEPVLAEKIRRGRELGMLAVEQEEKGNMGAAEAGYIKALSLLVPASKELDVGPEGTQHIRMKHKAKIKREAAAMLDRCEELRHFLAANGPVVPDEMPVFPGDGPGGEKKPSSSKHRVNDKNLPALPPPPNFNDEILISRLENRKNTLPGVVGDEPQPSNDKHVNRNTSSQQIARKSSPPDVYSSSQKPSSPISKESMSKFSSRQQSSKAPFTEDALGDQLPTDKLSSMHISEKSSRPILPQEPSSQQHQQVRQEHDSSQYSTPSNMPTLDITKPLSSPPPLPLPPSMHSAGVLIGSVETSQNPNDGHSSNADRPVVSKCFLCGTAADLQTKCGHLFCSNCGNQVASVFESCPVSGCNEPLAVEDFVHIIS